MLSKTFLLVLIYHICLTDVRALWSCLSDSECPELAGSICVSGVCVCTLGHEPTLSGTLCSRIAPYYTSTCVEDSQCAGLFTGFQCRIERGATDGECLCQSSHHYFLGRCWRSVDYGASCIRDEECQNTLRDPYSMSCLDGVCGCSQGYYLRQRGECRRMGLVPGDGCVLNSDCHFHNAACDELSFSCYDTTESTQTITTPQISSNATLSAKQDGGSDVIQGSGVQQDGGVRRGGDVIQGGGVRQDGGVLRGSDVIQGGGVREDGGVRRGGEVIKGVGVRLDGGVRRGGDVIQGGGVRLEGGVRRGGDLILGGGVRLDGGVQRGGDVIQGGGLRQGGRVRQDGVACTNGACFEPFVCHSRGVCVCPSGYYASADGSLCLAYLGSPVDSAEYCRGLFAVVEGGICTCPPNFYYDRDMKDCVKAARRLNDSCVTDAMCHTFGAASACAPPESSFGLRQCFCRDGSVWDGPREMCRLFSGIGEVCTVDSDCMAGDSEAVCVRVTEEVSRCACPANLTAIDGLCLKTGLGLGESCQVSDQCTRTVSATCDRGVCACDFGYQQLGNVCLPELGGSCTVDGDCVVEHSKCLIIDGRGSCLCKLGYVTHEQRCWPASEGINSTCNVTEQCEALGDGAVCRNRTCVCAEKFHYSNGSCRDKIGLFQACDSSSECFLDDSSDKLVCRNGLCQCNFLHPYSEELGTCVSGAAKVISNIGVIVAAIFYLFLK